VRDCSWRIQERSAGLGGETAAFVRGILDDATVFDIDLQRINYFLEELRDECQEIQAILAPAQTGTLGAGIDQELVALLHQMAAKVEAAWQRAVNLRLAHVDAMAPGGLQMSKPLPLPAIAVRGPYQFAPADVTFLGASPSASRADTPDSSSDEISHQQMMAYVTAVDDSTLPGANQTPSDVTVCALEHQQYVLATPYGQGCDRVTTGALEWGWWRAAMQHERASFGGPPLATSEQRPAVIGSPQGVAEEDEEKVISFPPHCQERQGEGTSLE
jgi:hypothetical protein